MFNLNQPNPNDYLIARKNEDDTECKRDLCVLVSSDGYKT